MNLLASLFAFICLLPLLLGAEIPKIPVIKSHGCLEAGYTSELTGFDYVSNQSIPQVPHRTFDGMHDHPYLYRLDKNLSVGQTIYIAGSINENSKNDQTFTINLLAKVPFIDYNGGIVALHVDFRLNRSEIVYSVLENGKWGKTEKTTSIPFQRGQNFDIRIRAELGKFEIRLNGKKYHEFAYRFPLEVIDYVSVGGEINVTDLRIGGHLFPTPPFEIQLPGGHLNINDRIAIYGVMTGKEFAVNLLDKNNFPWLYFNPRVVEKVVVRNFGPKRIWDFNKEERDGGFPFEEETEFKIEILNAPNGLEILVNGKIFTTFRHRVENAATDYNKLQFLDSVEIRAIEICNS